MKSKILVVDDEPDVVDLIEFNLKAAGFSVISAGDGEKALRRARREAPALIVLDLMLPEVDGFEICKTLRRDPATANIPVIMLTARAEEVDRVLGLELGADDYLTKPFSPRELILRVRNLLKRREGNDQDPEEILIGEMLIDIPKHRVTVEGREVELTPTEFNLLSTLARRRGRVQSRDRLLRDVWNYDGLLDTRTVDTHIRRLREKLGPAARFLDTVRGVGYRMSDA